MNQTVTFPTEDSSTPLTKANCASEKLCQSDKKKKSSNKMVQVSELLALNSDGSVHV